MSDEEKNRSIGTRLWSSITGLLALVTALGEAFDALPRLVLGDKQHWVTGFLLDVAVILALSAIAPVVLRRIAWRHSLARVFAESRVQFGILCAMAIASLILLVPLTPKARELFGVRYQGASIDWHAVKTLHLFGTRRYSDAAKELKLVAPTSLVDLRPVLQSDLDGRFKDAENLVRRFNAHKEAGRSPTFSELLMVGRAARLARQAKGVDVAMTEARKILEGALAEYRTGVKLMRNREFAAAADRMRRSKTICRGLLHQDLLLRYAHNESLAGYSADERGLILYYLRTKDDQLNADLRAYPPIRLFAATR